MQHIQQFLEETKMILEQISVQEIAAVVECLRQVKERQGRIFFLGVGGGAAHAAHAVNDFRKICNIESYSPSDHISELTARINDEGWETAYVRWLEGSRLSARDLIFVFSVGGGDAEKKISMNLVRSLEYAQKLGTPVCGIVGRKGGTTAKAAAACIVVPPVSEKHVTVHTEGWQAVLWHLLISHPALQQNPTKWESMAGRR